MKAFVQSINECCKKNREKCFRYPALYIAKWFSSFRILRKSSRKFSRIHTYPLGTLLLNGLLMQPKRFQGHVILVGLEEKGQIQRYHDIAVIGPVP